MPPSPPDERADAALIASLFLKHAEELRRFLIGILRRHDQAHDALQATFSKAVEYAHTANSETLKGWLFRVAYHEAINLKRRAALDHKAHERLAAAAEPEPTLPEFGLLRWETVQQVREALDCLPPEQRQVVVMRIYEEKKFVTIAEELGVPLGTVLTRMQLALKKLRRLLDAPED